MFTAKRPGLLNGVYALLFAAFFLLRAGTALAQEKKTVLNDKLIQRSFSVYAYTKVPVRKVLSLKNKSLLHKLNPVTYISAGALFAYQNVISQQIQANCMYEISCSEFTKRSIEQHGFLKGLLTGINQLTNCMPSAIDDHCAYVISKDLKIINSVED